MNIHLVLDRSGQRRGRREVRAMAFVSCVLLSLGLLGAPSQSRADDWGFAWELGAITATPIGNPFVFRISAAKYYAEEFSLGPSFYLTPYGDNAMYSGSLNAQFHVPVEEFRVSPFLGLGVAHRKSKHDDDTALWIPMGLSVDRPVGERLYLIGTFGINMHGGIALEGQKDDVSIGLTAGISYSP
jgi:opacity protein-like surface antigen